MAKPQFGCKKCGQRATVEELNATTIRVTHCGIEELMTNQKREFGNKDNHGRLHGPQPTFGVGETHYRHGHVEYLDDGNGNVYDANEDYDG